MKEIFETTELFKLIIIFVLIFIFFYIKWHKIDNNFERNVLRNGFFIKTVFVIISIIFLYFFEAGDTLIYFNDTSILAKLIIENPHYLIKLLTNTYYDLPSDIQKLFPNNYYYQVDHATARVATFAAVPYIIGFNSYWGPFMFFSYFAFFASWKLFKVLNELFSSLKDNLFYVLFCIPSILIWTNGLLKDPLSQSGLMLTLCFFCRIFIQKRNNIKNYFFLLLSIRLLIIIKSYIFFIIFPFLLLFIVKSITKSDSINPLLKITIYFFNILVIVLLGYYLFSNPEMIGRFALESILEEIQYRTEYANVENAGDVNINSFDGSILGIFKLFPAGLSLVFLRPFIWEVKNLLMFISSLENILFQLLFLKVLYRNKFNFLKLLKIVYSNNFIKLLFFYSLLLGGFIGISNNNFGTISRYRIPALMCLLLVFIYLNNLNNQKSTE